MVKPDPRQAQALLELRARTDVVEFLQACFEDTKTRLVMQPETDTLRVLQGEARVLQALLGYIIPDTTQQSGKR
jgi:hypothetical protein